MGAYAYQDGEIVSNQTATILEGCKIGGAAREYFLAVEPL